MADNNKEIVKLVNRRFRKSLPITTKNPKQINYFADETGTYRPRLKSAQSRLVEARLDNNIAEAEKWGKNQSELVNRRLLASDLGNHADLPYTAERTATQEILPTAENIASKSLGLGEETVGKIGLRSVGKSLPIFGDLLVPYGSINGGDMYPQQNGLYVNAAGGPLPQPLQLRNTQELANRAKENAMFQQRDVESRRALGDQNYAANFTPTVVAPYQTNISRYIGNQQSDEPQSIAHQLAGQDSEEPVSIAKQLSMQDADVQSPRIQPPQSLYEHYLKIYGNPDKARAAINGNYK